MFASLHRSQPWGKNGASTWKSFLEAEGLRVQDLDLRPDDDDVRALACALVAAQMDQLSTSAVVGVSQMSVSRYVRSASKTAVRQSEPAAHALPQSAASMKTPQARRQMAESVVNELVRQATEAPRVPTDALTLVVVSSEHVKSYVGEFISGLNAGGQLNDQGEVLLLQAVRELEALAGALRSTGRQRCVNV